jgi:hypothetical protein
MMNDGGTGRSASDGQLPAQSDHSIPHSSFILHHLSLIFFVVWLGLLLAGRSAMLRDPGSFWHVVAGQKMLAEGHVLRADPFSFTCGGQPWVADQWLAECGMAAIHAGAGWDGLLLLTAALLAAVYAWIAARLSGSGLHWLPAGLLLALILLLGAPQFHVRPLVLSIGLLGITFAWLIDVEAGRKPRRQLWWLVPLVILWANLHGGALAGIVTVGLCAAGWCVLAVGNRNSGKGGLRGVIQAAGLTIALVAATLINPYGPDLPRECLRTLTMPLPSILVEHAPLSLTEPIGWATVLLALGYLVVLLGVFPRRPRVVWLVPLVWFVLAVLRVRNASLFGIVAAIGLADMLPHSRVGAWLARRQMLGSPAASAGWRPALMPLLAVVAALAIQVAGLYVPVIGRGWARFDADHWPVELLPQLEQVNRSAAEGAPIFNDLNFGGFLIYHTPRLRVFVDDRCSLYGEEFLVAYERARRANPAQLDRWRQQYGFDYALVATGGQFDRYLAGADQWTCLAGTPAATLYRRK